MSKVIINPTFGTDIEFALVDKDTDKLISAVNRIGGTKQFPLQIASEIYRQEDNVAAELSMEPTKTWPLLRNRIMRGKSALEKYVSSQNLKIKALSSGIYDDDQLTTPESREFGCSPTLNAYTKNFNQLPCAEDTNLRTFGFHLHIGFPQTAEINTFKLSDICRYIIYCDAFLGIPSIIMDRDNRRRELYGKAGEFRSKKINEDKKEILIIEYRVLGGNLLFNTKTTTHVFKLLEKAIKNFNMNTKLPEDKTIRNIINTADINSAMDVCNELKIDIPDWYMDENGTKIINIDKNVEICK